MGAVIAVSEIIGGRELDWFYSFKICVVEL